MRPKKQKPARQDELFRARLDQIINLRHELVVGKGKAALARGDKEAAVEALREACQKAQSTIESLSDKKKDQLTLPDFDEAAFEALKETLAEN